MQINVTMNEQEYRDFMEWKDNINKDLYKKNGVSYIWDARKNEWANYTHVFLPGKGDVMSRKLLDTLGLK